MVKFSMMMEVASVLCSDNIFQKIPQFAMTDGATKGFLVSMLHSVVEKMTLTLMLNHQCNFKARDVQRLSNQSYWS